MLHDLLGGRRNRLLINSQVTVSALIILITAVSCAGPHADLPPPIAEIVEGLSGTDAPKQELVQRDEAQSKVRRPASKKASTPPKPNAQSDDQLYQEFLEWQLKRREQRQGQAVRWWQVFVTLQRRETRGTYRRQVCWAGARNCRV